MLILQTRLFPPRREGEVLPRATSQALVKLAERHRLVLVKAPAGYGKTTQLVEAFDRLQRRPRRVAWVTVGDLDGSAAELATYLAAALSSVGLPVPALPAEVLPGALQGLLSAPTEPLYIFIDDLHALHGSAAEQLWMGLVRSSGEAVHWVVGTRCSPQGPMARWRALGQLAELGVEDLRLNSEESQQLLQLMHGQALPAALAADAHRRSEGWPAALQLLAIALRRGLPAARLAPRMSGQQRDIAAFFREDVFDRLLPAQQQFLLHVAVLDRFTPELADAMTGASGGRAQVDALEQESLFVFALDDERRWYRFHPLFAEFVQSILAERAPALVHELHRRASRWFDDQGLLAEALDHATRSGDLEHAASLLDARWEGVNRQGGFALTARLSAALPQAVMARYPRVQLWRALYLAVEGRFDETRRLLDDVGAHLRTLSAEEAAPWRALLLHRRTMLAMFSDDVETLAPLCDPDRYAPPEDRYLRATMLLARLVSLRDRYRFAECDALDVRSADLLRDEGHLPALVWHTCTVLPYLVQRGRADEALARCGQAVDDALRCSVPGAETELLTLTLGLQAELLLERHELDRAREVFTRAHALRQRIGMLDDALALYLGRARLAMHDGDHALADSMLQEATSLAHARGWQRLHWHVVHERLRQALAKADLHAARQLARDAQLPDDGETLRPGASTTPLREAQALAWARLAMAEGRPAEAQRLLRVWVTFTEGCGAHRSALRVLLLQARVLHALGDERAALRAVSQSLVHAAATGHLFAYAEEGASLRPLLVRALAGPAPAGLHAKLALVLPSLPAAPGAGSPPAPMRLLDSASVAAGPVDALSPREIDILRLVGQGMLYKEVADRLGLTEGSVKWYMQQIYAKLGVRRRLRVIEKGRELGYL
jgi:LuxR family maltose regulon positive regulatory protein